MNSIYTEHPKEIFNVWAKHPDDICNGKEGKEFFSMIPHFFYEFNGDPNVEIIYAGPVRGTTILGIDDDILRNYILDIVTPNTKLLFDNLYEGHILSIIDKIYRVLSGTNIKHNQVYYFTGAMNSEEYHKAYCEEHNIEMPINVYHCNTWEYHTLKSSQVPKEIEYEIKPKSKTFLCFNRILRLHRFALMGLVLENNLLENSYYSFFDDTMYGKFSDLVFRLKNKISSETFRKIFLQYSNNRKRFPLKLNIEAHENINFVKDGDIQYFKDSYFSLVTETFFFPTQWHKSQNGNILEEDQGIFFSEKIFKPILMKHPFILLSRPHSLKYLRSIGYKTFSPFIDESYDDIENNEERLLAIVDEVSRLNRFSTDDWIEWQKNIKEIVDHNHSVIISRKKHEYTKRI